MPTATMPTVSLQLLADIAARLECLEKIKRRKLNIKI